MMRISALISILLLGCSLHARITSRELVPDAFEYTMDNGIVAVNCVPDASGVISGFHIAAENRQLIQPLEFSARVDDLLPRQVSTARSGMRELIFGVKMENHLNYRLISQKSDKNGSVLELYSRSFYGKAVSVNKKLTLPSNSSTVRITLDFFAGDKMDDSFTLWFNGIAQLGKQRDTVLLPITANISKRNKRRLYAFPQTGLYVDDKLEPQQFFAAPCQPWIAKVSPERPGVLAIIIRDNGDFVRSGIINNWKTPLAPLHTTELSFSPKTLKNGEKWQVCYEYAYFAGLKSMRTVAGNFALDMQKDELHISVCAPTPAGKLRVSCSGKEFSFDLGAMRPGMVAVRRLPGCTSGCELRGTLPGGVGFTLLPQLKGL